ncbi:MAG: hypothetical protein U0835_08285 [Isosphaeraceae bacterium]
MLPTLLAVLGMHWLAGCDSNSMLPPPPPELTTIPTTATSTPPARTVEMILRPGTTPDRTLWESVGRQEAGKRLALFSLAQPKPGSPASAQADLIRQAVKRGISSLVVEPVDDPEVAAALNEAVASGVPVVLMEYPVKAKDPARPLHRIRRAPFGKAVEPLAAAILKDLKAVGASESHALVTFNASTGPEGKADVDQICEALRKIGIARVDVVEFPSRYEEARKVLTAAVEKDPKVTVIVASEAEGVTGMLGTYDDTKSQRTLALGGLMTVDALANPAAMTNCAGVLDRNVPSMSREAVRRALELAGGGLVPEEIEIPLHFHPRSISASSSLVLDRPGTPVPPPR